MSNVIDIGERASALQNLVDEFVENHTQLNVFLERVRDSSTSEQEALGYINQAVERISRGERPDVVDLRGTPTLQSQPSLPSGEERLARRLEEEGQTDPTDGLSHHEVHKSLGDPGDAAREIQQTIQARGNRQGLSSLFDGNDISEIATLAAGALASKTNLAQILAEAPHLAKIGKGDDDPHINETYRLRKLFSKEKACDEVIDLVQRARIKEPLPRAIWKDIILDRTVAFDKLHASLDYGYDWNDEPKDFGGGFALVTKNQYISKKPIRFESEWTRVFDAWKAAVEMLYPHRSNELADYREFVVELFRAVPSEPSVAINFDADARDRYGKGAYRMDDRNKLNVPLFSQMFSGGRSARSYGKRASATGYPPGKRALEICENWNLGRCFETPCKGRRKHGICSECGDKHQAKGVPTCASQLWARRPALHELFPRSNSRTRKN